MSNETAAGKDTEIQLTQSSGVALLTREGFGLYQGNAIFRNQPSYNVFNKSIESADDSLYTYLNEVDSETLKKEQTPTEIFSCYTHDLALKDPRTKEPISQTIRDHTSEGVKEQTFSFPSVDDQEHHSTLSRDQQAACLRVLLAGQQRQQLPEDDFIIWRATESKRCTEQQVVQKYIYNYSQDQKEIMYKPMKSLVKAYQKWFQSKIEQVLAKRPSEEVWVTHTGLPQLNQCKSLQISDQNEVKLENVHLRRIVGELRYWPQEVKLERGDLRSLNIRLDRYVTATDTHYHLLGLLDDGDYWNEGHLFVLPLVSLLMLMTPTAAYVDLPTEMFLTITEIDEQKRIEFDAPLPAHHCGWHTNSFILSRAYEAFMSQSGQGQWIQMGVNSKEIMQESDSYSGDYKIHEIDTDYSYKGSAKSNQAFISWCLNGASSSSLQILTQMSVSGAKDPQAQQLLGCHHLKLENKPDCGLEIMTKYELLKIWLQLKLLKTEQGHCSRLALSNFEPILEEELTLDSVEQQLHEYYNTNMHHLLANLHEFLKLFIGLPPDIYLLRYSSKYKDKFLLCRRTQEITPNSFSLGELLQKESLSLPSEHSFLTQNNSYLPISTKLCGPLHLANQMLPCAFPSKRNGKCVRKKNNTIKSKVKPITKLETVSEKRRATISLRRRQHKSQQKARSRARKREAAKMEAEQQKQLDKILYL